MSPKIAVLGTGANGAAIAADLVTAGHNVTLIDPWPANVEAIRDRGITVELPDETRVTPASALHFCQIAEIREPFDMIFLLVKAYDTLWASQACLLILKKDGVIVGLQNGMTAEPIASVVGADRTIAAVIEVTSTMLSPGHSIRQSPHDISWFAVGGMSKKSHAQAPQVAEILRAAGTVEVRENILSAKFMKLIVNCAELGPSGILGEPIVSVANDERLLEFSNQAGREAIKVGRALGYTPVMVFGVDPADYDSDDLFADALLHAIHTQYVLPHSKGTVLQDWEKGRRSEINDINGWVTRKAQGTGIETPVNVRVAEIAGRIERGELTPRTENSALLVGQ